MRELSHDPGPDANGFSQAIVAGEHHGCPRRLTAEEVDVATRTEETSEWRSLTTMSDTALIGIGVVLVQT